MPLPIRRCRKNNNSSPVNVRQRSILSAGNYLKFSIRRGCCKALIALVWICRRIGSKAHRKIARCCSGLLPEWLYELAVNPSILRTRLMPQFVGNEMRPWGLEFHIAPQRGVNDECCREEDSAL